MKTNMVAISQLWESFSKEKNQEKRIELRSEISLYYEQLVRILCSRMYPKYRDYYDFEEFLSMGYIGILDAIDKFKINQNVKFETYASIRIKGSILDQIRKFSDVSRGDQQKRKSLIKEKEMLESELGRESTQSELIEFIQERQKISYEEALKFFKESSDIEVKSFDDDACYLDLEDYSVNVFDEVYSNLVSNELEEMMNKKLNKRQKNVLIMSYYGNLPLKEIGKRLGVSESRAFQIRKVGLEKLKQEIMKTKKIDVA